MSILRKLVTILKIVVEILISVILWTLFGPIFWAVFAVNEVIRVFVSILLHIHNIRYHTKLTLVSEGSDNIWHYKKAGNARQNISLRFSSDPVDLEKYQSHFFTKVFEKREADGRRTYSKLMKTFTQKFGYYCLRDDSEKFDIKYHVKMYDLSHPGDNRNYFTEKEFLQTIVPHLAKDIEDTKPQWEEVIVQRVKLNDYDQIQSVRCFRFHHGYMDGVSSALLMFNCGVSSIEKQKGGHFVVDPRAKYNAPEVLVNLAKFYSILTAPCTLVKSFISQIGKEDRYSTKTYSGRKHFGYSEKLETSMLMKIKSAMEKVLVPSILVTAVGSALRKMETQFPNKKLTGDGGIVTMGILNAIAPYKDFRPRNQVTVTNVFLPIGEMSWTQRLMKVNKRMKKKNPMYFVTYYCLKLLGRLPSFVIQLSLDVGGANGQSFSFSNVPVSKKEGEMWGSHINEVGGWPLLMFENGVAIVAAGYGNFLRFWVVADDVCLLKEEFEFFVAQIGVELRIIAEECSKQDHIVVVIK